MKNKMYLKVRIISDPVFGVLFGYFDEYPNTFINVTDYLSEQDANDFWNLIDDDDPWIETMVKMDVEDIFKIEEELGHKLAKEIVYLREKHDDIE